jgi:hypothetical protein
MSGEAVLMGDEEIDAFLGTGGAGVLSFADGGEAYSIPVSYGYDASKRHLYVRLGYEEGSEKRQFVKSTKRVSFVVHDETSEGWQSVVARGRLDEITESSVDGTVVKAIRRMDIPLVSIFDEPTRDVEFQLYRLAPDELTGRKEAPGGNE